MWEDLVVSTVTFQYSIQLELGRLLMQNSSMEAWQISRKYNTGLKETVPLQHQLYLTRSAHRSFLHITVSNMTLRNAIMTEYSE